MSGERWEPFSPEIIEPIAQHAYEDNFPMPTQQPVGETTEKPDDLAQDFTDANFGKKVKSSLLALAEDFRESESKANEASRLGAIVLTQGIDRSRLSFLAIPGVITHTYEQTNSSLLAGAAGAAAYIFWGTVVSETLGRNMRHLPRTLNAATRAFPGFTSFFTENLPGLETTKTEKAADSSTPASRASRTRRFGRSALQASKTHIARGTTGIGAGSTPYVASSVVMGKNQKETSKTGLKLNLDTGALIGAAGTGITKGLEELAMAGHVTAAENIDNWVVSNNYFWSAVGFGSIYLNYLYNKKQGESGVERIPLPLLERPTPRSQR